MSDQYTIRPLHPTDYAAVAALWAEDLGIITRGFEDSEAGFGLMVRYNPDLCLGLWRGDDLLGAVQAGFDGRRIYIYHFVIAAAHRRQGWGKQLAKALRKALTARCVPRAHLFVMADNAIGQAFWSGLGWCRRDELQVYTLVMEG